MSSPTIGVILVGHGGVPRDFPRALITELKGLEGQRKARGGPASTREIELETQVRCWPRTATTDPYQAGIESLAAQLRPALAGARLLVAYNEFCAPTLDEATATLVADGVRRIVVMPSMLTPGGVHSEVDIPEALADLRARHRDVEIVYAWPFDLSAVARMLAAQVGRFATAQA